MSVLEMWKLKVDFMTDVEGRFQIDGEMKMKMG